MATTELLQNISLDAAADLSTHQFKFMDVDATGKAALAATEGIHAIGVLQNKPKLGESAEVAVMGVPKVIAGTGGITAGDRVKTDGTGTAIPAVALGTDHVVGRALTSGAAGELVSVLLVSGYLA